MSLSAIDTFEKFGRLGFKVNNSYPISQVLEIINSREFKGRHSCHFPDQTIINQLNEELIFNIDLFVGVVGTEY